MELICAILYLAISFTTYVSAEDATTSTTAMAGVSGTKPISAKPQYSVLSYLAGLVVMMVFVMVPVGLMAYRNRNSIVEFIKNR